MSEEDPDDGRIAKKVAWIAELETRRKNLAGARKLYFRIFVGVLVLSFFGFFYSTWAGVATLVTGILFCYTGFYMVLVRGKEYLRVIRETEEDIAWLRDPSLTKKRRRDY